MSPSKKNFFIFFPPTVRTKIEFKQEAFRQTYVKIITYWFLCFTACMKQFRYREIVLPIVLFLKTCESKPCLNDAILKNIIGYHCYVWQNDSWSAGMKPVLQQTKNLLLLLHPIPLSMYSPRDGFGILLLDQGSHVWLHYLEIPVK